MNIDMIYISPLIENNLRIIWNLIDSLIIHYYER